MGRLSNYVLRTFFSWERSARIAFLMAIALLIGSLLVMRFGPEQVRQPALIGFIGLLFGTQIIFMWANRTMVTAYTLAQRHYLEEDFEAARTILEKAVAEDKADANVFTLLGNTYRQLGRLDESEEVVKKAIAIRPNDHFPRYGFGRTLLIKGQYAAAAQEIKRALEAGAPFIVHIDLGEAYYRQGDFPAARTALEAVSTDEPQRAALKAYLLHRMGGNPPDEAVLREGLPYWQEVARRFAQTPYGSAVSEDVEIMQAMLEAQ
jgi:tetratricopeptide (TPR) repeat protein